MRPLLGVSLNASTSKKSLAFSFLVYDPVVVTFREYLKKKRNHLSKERSIYTYIYMIKYMHTRTHTRLAEGIGKIEQDRIQAASMAQLLNCGECYLVLNVVPRKGCGRRGCQGSNRWQGIPFGILTTSCSF